MRHGTSELRLATRSSLLALAQSRRVVALLERAHPCLTVRLVEVDSSGDQDQSSPVAALSEMGAFVRTVQQRVMDGDADLAVHSLKDLPTFGPQALTIAAYPERESPFDVLVGADLAALREGALIGTGSPRRVAQLRRLRPDLRTTELRGNVDTRLRKVRRGMVDAAVLAEAGLRRLGHDDAIARVLAVDEMVPAPGQGALAVETLRDGLAFDLVQAIDDSTVRRIVAAERELLVLTRAGCRSALGALATSRGDVVELHAFVEDERGARRVTVTGSGPVEAAENACKELGL
ncbi:MAG: hydroxymethylbilane synthase [Actinomycetota bacterium]